LDEGYVTAAGQLVNTALVSTLFGERFLRGGRRFAALIVRMSVLSCKRREHSNILAKCAWRTKGKNNEKSLQYSLEGPNERRDESCKNYPGPSSRQEVFRRRAILTAVKWSDSEMRTPASALIPWTKLLCVRES
jgi:hypothetical protein